MDVAVFRGETLRVLGLETGRIEEVFGFEPADIVVNAGRLVPYSSVPVKKNKKLRRGNWVEGFPR
jgi:hypothetical protein